MNGSCYLLSTHYNFGNVLRTSNSPPEGIASHLNVDPLLIDVLALKNASLTASHRIANLIGNTEHSLIRNNQRAIRSLPLTTITQNFHASIRSQEAISIIHVAISLSRPTLTLSQLRHGLTILVQGKGQRTTTRRHILQIQSQGIQRWWRWEAQWTR